MRLHLLLLALGAARALWLPAVRPPVRLRAASAVCSADDEPWDELDAMDTTSSWDEEIAAMEAWKANADSNLMYVYADQAHDHSKSAATYACYGNILGILFWVYMLFFAEGKDREWLKDWDIDEWWSDGP